MSYGWVQGGCEGFRVKDSEDSGHRVDTAHTSQALSYPACSLSSSSLLLSSLELNDTKVYEP